MRPGNAHSCIFPPQPQLHLYPRKVRRSTSSFFHGLDGVAQEVDDTCWSDGYRFSLWQLLPLLKVGTIFPFLIWSAAMQALIYHLLMLFLFKMGGLRFLAKWSMSSTIFLYFLIPSCAIQSFFSIQVDLFPGKDLRIDLDRQGVRSSWATPVSVPRGGQSFRPESAVLPAFFSGDIFYRCVRHRWSFPPNPLEGKSSCWW